MATRSAKDAAFKSGPDSPIPADKRASFTGLEYYPVDLAYRVPAFLTRESSAAPAIIVLETSQHEPRKMRRVGTLGFALNGASYKLAAFVEDEATDVARLFVPFQDLTSGTETYGGGRYLELDRTTTGLYDLDFNKAYNPFCVYNSTYDCPIPPKENRLPVAIRAGEKLPAATAIK